MIVLGFVAGFFLFGGRTRSDAQLHLERARSFVEELTSSLTYCQVLQDGWYSFEDPKKYIAMVLFEARHMLERECTSYGCLDLVSGIAQLEDFLCRSGSGFFDLVFDAQCNNCSIGLENPFQKMCGELHKIQGALLFIFEKTVAQGRSCDSLKSFLELLHSVDALVSAVNEEWLFCQKLQICIHEAAHL